MAIPWNVTTAVYLQSKSTTVQDTAPVGVFFKPDGTKMYISGQQNDSIYEYNLSYAWNISTAVYLQSKSATNQDTSPVGIFFKPDGTKMYMLGNAKDSIFEYDLSSAWDISTAVYLQSKSTLAQDGNSADIFFKPDGMKMYIVGYQYDSIFEYDLSSAWDVTSASYLQSKSTTAQDSTPVGLFFRPDGAKMYVSGVQRNRIYEYDLSSAWDITSAIYLQSNSTVAIQASNIRTIFLTSNGTKMYVVGESADSIYEYNMLSYNPVRLLFLAIMSAVKSVVYTELDYMEYANDAAAQAAYVTDGEYGSEAVDQQETTIDYSYALGDAGGVEKRSCQSFQLSAELQITAVEVRRDTLTLGTPSGNWTMRIETDNSGEPSGTLVNANASIVVSPPAENAVVKGTFATPFILSAATTYWLVILCDNQTTNNYWKLSVDSSAGYGSGNFQYSNDGVWQGNSGWDIYFKVYTKTLPTPQCYSEATIKSQGSYSLKAVAAITSSLNKSLVRTIGSPIDLTGKTQIKFDIYSSRTGSNISLNIHDSGGVTTSTIAVVNTVNTWETKTWDISAVSDANKDAIDQLYLKIANADAANTFYIDNVRYA